MEQREQPVDRLAAVGLVEQAVELCRRGAQPPDDLTPAQAAPGDPFLGFEGQSIEELVPEILRVLIVFEDLIDVDRALLSGGESIGEAFPADVGRISILAYGNQNAAYEVRTSKPFFRLLKVTLRIFTARPPRSHFTTKRPSR